MKITNVRKNWVSIVEDIDCANMSADQQEQIFRLFAERKLIIFKNQKLDDYQLKDFCSIFGNVWTKVKENYESPNKKLDEKSYLQVVSESGLLKKIKLPWHVDLTHLPTQLLPNRILYAVELEGEPSGTRFVDTIQGLKHINKETYDYLSNAFALCKAPYETAWTQYVRRPALQWHPIHRDFALIADELFTTSLEHEIPLTVEFKEWILDVINQMITPETEYTHEWELNDLMLYDNSSTMHSRAEFEGKRKLKRITWDQNWNQYGLLK